MVKTGILLFICCYISLLLPLLLFAFVSKSYINIKCQSLPMVVHGKPSRMGPIIRTEPSKEYMRNAFLSSLTIMPLNLDEVPDSYIPPITYALALSLMVSFVFNIFVYFKKNVVSLVSISVGMLYVTLGIWFYLLVSCFVFSFFSAMIISEPHSSKHFGLAVSAFTYMPLTFAVTLSLGKNFVWAVSFANVMLMNYYIKSTYAIYFPPKSQRESVIHGIYLFIVYYLILQISLSIPAGVYTPPE